MCDVYVFTLREWTGPSSPLGEVVTFALFRVTCLSVGNFYENESNLLKMLKVLTKLCLYI